jgi:tetratricopeptide (TPR) repeat protein
LRAEKRAEDARDDAVAMNKFFTEDLLGRGEPSRFSDLQDPTLRDVLVRAEERVKDRFANQPKRADNVRRAIVETYHCLGEMEGAERLWRLVYENARRQSPDSNEMLEDSSELTDVLRHLRKLDDQVVSQSELAAEGLSRLRGPNHRATLNSRDNLGLVYRDMGRNKEAIAVLEDVVKRSDARLSPDDLTTLNYRSHLATCYLAAGQFDAGIKLCQELLRRAISRFGRDHLVALEYRVQLATTYQDAGRASEAVPLLEKALKIISSRFGANSRVALGMPRRDRHGPRARWPEWREDPDARGTSLPARFTVRAGRR